MLALLVVLGAGMVTAAEYQEGIHLIRPDSSYITNTYAYPEYLTIEDLTFVSCLEDPEIEIRNSILCLDDNSFEDLESAKWGSGNCYISSYNLENFECEQLLLQAEYSQDDENLRLTKKIRVNVFSTVLNTILDTQYSDGGWLDPLSTAYGAWALSYYKDLYSDELELAIDWLKDNRNEEKKCWPKAPCNVGLTANIFGILTLSNYTANLLDDPDARRIVNDAKNWFEELQNDYVPGEDMNITITSVSNDTTLVLVGYDGEVLDTNFTLDTDETRSYSIDAKQDAELVVIADHNYIIEMKDDEEILFFSYQGDNLSYHIPGTCWSQNIRGEPCNPKTSMYIMSGPLDEKKLEHAKDWARTNVSHSPVVGKYFGMLDSVSDTAWYIYNMYKDDGGEAYFDEMIDYLLYKQNNEGSWDQGTSELKAISSASAVISLFEAGFNRTSETIYDAEEWATSAEDNISENNTAALASTFYILKHNARPLLTSQPQVIIMETPEMDVDIFNPTTFDLHDLTYSFSSSIENYVSIEEKEDISSFTYRKHTLTRKGISSDDLYGFLTIYNMAEPVAEIPIILTDTPMLNVSYPEILTVFGESAELKFDVTKSSHEFVCSMTWDSPGISTLGSFKVRSSTANMLIEFDEARTLEDVYSGTLFCKARGKTIVQPISVYIKRFSSVPLTIWPEDLVVNSSTNPVVLHLKNNLDSDLHVVVSLDRYANYFTFNKEVDLNPNEDYNLTFYNQMPSDFNLSSVAIVELLVLNKTELITMIINVNAQEPEAGNLGGLIATIVIVLIFVGALGYLVYRFREVIFVELNKLTFWRIKTEKKKEASKIQVLKKEEHAQAIVNLFNILRLQNRDDKEIAQKLLRDFSREDIKEALLTAGAALPLIDEEEPEKAIKK